MDDVIVISASKTSLETVKHELMKHLKMKYLGLLDHFLGVTFVGKEEEAWLTQNQYTLQRLKRFRMSESRPVSPPIEIVSSRTAGNGSKGPDQTMYEEVIESHYYVPQRIRGRIFRRPLGSCLVSPINTNTLAELLSSESSDTYVELQI